MRAGLSHAGHLLLAAAAAAAAGPASSGELAVWLDSVELHESASRARHAVRVRLGAPRSERAAVGSVSLPVSGMALQPGGSLRARLRPTPEAGRGRRLLWITLASGPREWGAVQGIRVRLDGREALHWVERDAGAGVARSLFLPLSAEAAPRLVEVAADPASEARVTVASIRLVEIGESATSRRMQVALVSSMGHGYEIDEAELRTLVRRTPAHRRLVPQAAVLYNFCTRDPAASRREIERLAGLAESARIPLRIAFQVHWGGTPKGIPDGAGGTFADVPYQQVTFDPADAVEDPGLRALMGDRYDVRFGLSVPNVWGDTPWLTFNHPRLNQFRRIRLTAALRAWTDARDRLAAAGLAHLLPGEHSTGDETVYWAAGVDDSRYTGLNGGRPRSRLAADFNPFVVADALRDGIDLDPRDGLNGRERFWLHLNLARQQQRLVDWMLEALPAEPIRPGSRTPYAPDLVRRNLFTEPFGMPVFPLKGVDPHRPGIELGCVLEGRPGAAWWSGAEMLPWLLRQREWGRPALPNLECTGARNDSELAGALRAAYACGHRFAVLYNWHRRGDIGAVLREFAASLDRPAGIRREPGDGEWTGTAASWDFTAPADAFGVNRVDFYPAGPGRARVRLRVHHKDGADPGEVAVTTEVAGGKRAAIYLPALFPVEPGRRFRATLESLAGPITLRLALDGRPAVEVLADLEAERLRSEAIADRQDAIDLVESLRRIHAAGLQPYFARDALESAENALGARRFRSAYTAGIRAEQLALPAAFDLEAPGGRLAPYWIQVQCPGGPLRAVISAYGERAAIVTLRSASAQTVGLRWGPVSTSAALSPGVPAEVALDLGPRARRPDSLAREQPEGARPRRPRRRRIRRLRRQQSFAPPQQAAPRPPAGDTPIR